MKNLNKDLVVQRVSESHERRDIQNLRMGVWFNKGVPQDREFGENLLKSIEMLGGKTTSKSGKSLSPEGITPGQDIRYGAMNLFEEADIVHVVVSKEAMANGDRLYVAGMKGIKSAEEGKLDDDVFVIPVVMDKSGVPGMFAGKTPLDLSNSTQEEAGDKIVRTWQFAASRKSRR